MPIPKPNKDEKSQQFVARCMDDEMMKKEYPESKQRVAVCLSQTKASLIEQVCDIISYNDIENEDYEILTEANLFIPREEDYIDFGEQTEEYEFNILAKYKYMDPVTQEYYFFQTPGVKRKNNRNLVFVSEASEYQGRKVTLNKPFRTPGGPKKFSVYVKNDKGNVVKVNFGDPNMKIKKNIPERRKSFRARHNCDNPGPKWKARYWSCKAW